MPEGLRHPATDKAMKAMSIKPHLLNTPMKITATSSVRQVNMVIRSGPLGKWASLGHE